MKFRHSKVGNFIGDGIILLSFSELIGNTTVSKKSPLVFGPTYDHNYFTPIHSIENRHFWFQARNRVIAALIKKITKDLPAGYRTLEIGCGTGNVLKVIQDNSVNGKVMGIDLYRDGLKYARERVSCPLIQADLYHLPFQTKFELIGMFDVLEHLPDDQAVLKLIINLLSSSGYLFLTVPAYPQFWSYFDVASHHERRYLLGTIKQELINAGFLIEYITYYMTPIYPLIWFTRHISTVTSGNRNNHDLVHDLTMKELRVIPVINNLLLWLLTQEVRLLTHNAHLPFGTSILALARKL